MHDDNNVENIDRDGSTPPAQATNPSGASSPSGGLEQRRQRIADYLNAAMSNPMPEVALIGGINADLASLEIRLSQSIEAVLAECACTQEYLDAVPEGVEMLLKVSRQIERGTRLAKDLARTQAKPEAMPQPNMIDPAP